MPFTMPNATNPVEVFSYANSVTGFMFWQLMLLAVFLVSYMALISKNSSSKSLGASGFLTGLVAAFMYMIGLIQETPLVIALVVAIGGFVLLLFSKE